MKTSKLLVTKRTRSTSISKASAALVATAMMASSSFALTVTGTYNVNGTQNLNDDVSLRGSGVIAGTNTAILNLTGSSNHYDDMRSGTVNDVNLSGSNARFVKTTSGTVTLNSNNTYGGRTDIEGGTLILGGTYGNVLPTGTDVTITGTSTLNINGNSQTIRNLTLSGSHSRIIGAGEIHAQDVSLRSGTLGSVIASANSVTTGSNNSRVTINSVNTYTATTTVVGGTTRLSATDAIASSTNVVVNRGVVDFRASQTFLALSGTGGTVEIGSHTLTVGGANANTTFGGELEANGDGSIVKVGSGDLLLTGNSGEFDGTLTINDGSVSIGGNDRLGRDSTLIIDGDNATFNTDIYQHRVEVARLTNGGIVGSGTLSASDYFDLENGYVDAVLSGSGDLYKYTSGTVTINSQNTYDGHTYIEDGTLIAGTNNIFSDSDGVYVGGTNGQPVFDIAGTTQSISELILINGLITNSGTLGSITVDDDAILQSGTVNAVLSGSYGIVKNTASGIVVLTAENDYTGETRVDDGFLLIGNGSTGSISSLSNVVITGSTSAIGLDLADGSTFSNDVLLVDGGALGAVQSGETEISSVITGSGDFYQVGLGRTILTGSSSFTGSAFVESGELIIDGSVEANVEVDGGVIGGNGFIGGYLANGSGVVSPGRSIGTLTVGNGYYQGNNGVLYIEIADKNNYDRLVVTGTAALDGTLHIASVKGKKKTGDKYTIITADDVEGTFSNLEKSNTLSRFEVEYLADSVVVEYIEESILAFAKNKGLTPNQQAIAKALDRANKRGNLNSLINTLYSLDTNDVGTVLSLLSPEQISQIYQIGFANAETQFMNLDRRMSDVRDGAVGFSTNGLALSNSRGTLNYDGMPITNGRDGLSLAGFDGKSIVGKQTVAPIVEQSRWGFFATGNGEWADVETTQNARGSEFRTGGFTLGVDYRVSDNLVVGFAGGYANTTSKLWNDGKIDLNSGRGSVYASLFGGGFYLNTQVGGAYNSYTTKRGTIGGKAKGDTEGGEFNALLGGGYDYRVGGFTIGPVASMQYTYLGLNGYQESGSSANLMYGGQNQDSLKSSLGAKIAYAWNVGGLVIKPEVRAQWQHEFLDSTAAIESGFVGGGSTFTVDGPSIGRDSLLLDAGVAVQFNPAVSVFAYYTGEIGRQNYSSNAINGGFRINF